MIFRKNKRIKQNINLSINSWKLYRSRFFIKDQNSNKYLLYKFGSAKTILKHNHKTIEFTNFLPPLGIIKDLKNEPFIIELEDKDTIIFSTDGIESIEK